MFLLLTMVFAGLAALLHGYIFTMESITWTSAKTRKIFGNSEQAAQSTKEMALNQGYYNLFLGIAAAIGVVMLATGELAIGRTLVFTATGSMLAAALVLVVANPTRARSALTQGLFPLLAVICCALSMI